MAPRKVLLIWLGFSLDRGGTFTDVWAGLPGRSDVVFKLLSVDPANYDDAPTEGIAFWYDTIR